jgi:multidrug efflux system membrane fusion protein
MNRSIFIALLVILAVGAWMASGQFGGAPQADSSPTDNGDASGDSAEPRVVAMKVQVRRQQAQNTTREIVIQGQVEPLRMLHLRAETAGSVIDKPASKGETVASGDPILQLAVDGREADLAVARANVVQATNEYEAARKLQRQGLQSQFSLESAAAKLEAAKAQVTSATLEIENTSVVAPFDGVLEDLQVEVGDFIDRGGAIGTLVDHSKLLITGEIPQQNIADVKIDQQATASLITGDEVSGTVRYVSSMADPATRSFRVEVLVDNPPERVMTGVSAEIRIPTAQLRAHLISPAILALGDAGELGVKAVDDENKVTFYPVEVVKTESQGAWVTGIPDDVNLITLGQGFVNAGELVQPVTDPDS